MLSFPFLINTFALGPIRSVGRCMLGLARACEKLSHVC